MKIHRALQSVLLGTLFMPLLFPCLETQAAQEPASEVALKPNTVEYKSGGLRDPFYQEKKPEVIKKMEEAPTQKKPLPTLKIQGIVWGSSMPQAIINNKVLKIGDKIEDASIVEINREGIVILFEKQKYSLSSPGVVSQEASFKIPQGEEKKAEDNKTEDKNTENKKTEDKNPEGGKNEK